MSACFRCDDSGWIFVDADSKWLEQFPDEERAARLNSVLPCPACPKGRTVAA